MFHRLYLIVGTERSAVAVCGDRTDIHLDRLTGFGEPVEVYQIGIAEMDTPPGLLLLADTATGLTRIRPLGRKV